LHTGELTGGINTGAGAEMNTSSHHDLRPLRYEKSRGRQEGIRQLLCLSDLRNELVLPSPRRRIYRLLRALMRRARLVCLRRWLLRAITAENADDDAHPSDDEP